MTTQQADEIINLLKAILAQLEDKIEVYDDVVTWKGRDE